MNSSPKILINCSNLHHGGGVAVATSFLSSLHRSHQTKDIFVLVSSLVHKNLLALGVTADQFERYDVKDFLGIEALWTDLDEYFSGVDLVFTVFGPAYFLRKRTRHIFGLAQPYVVYPTNIVEQSLPTWRRLAWRLKHGLQALFFTRADELIVELEHVKTGLLKQRLFERVPIHIVNSAVDDIYKQQEKWQAVVIPKRENRLKLGVVSKNYPHKNLKCFPLIQEILRKEYALEADFFVTFTDEEWAECNEQFRRSVRNVGPLTLAQCPTFYQALDGVVFPSLLECFSAVPLETMMMKKPLFASNLPFMVDICNQYAIYVDPLSPQDIAKNIYTWFQKIETERDAFLQEAYSFSMSYPDATARAVKYLDILRQKLNGETS